MTDSTDFLDLFIEEIGSLNKGSLRLTEQNIKFHHDNTGNILNLNAKELRSIKWQRLGNRDGIKFIFQDGKKYRIGGFKETDFDKLNGFSKNRWNIEIEKIDLSLKGCNYGDFNVDGQSVEFAIDGKPCFEVPLSNVSNVVSNVANKNEAVLEFHQNDDCPVALVEMRFHMPTNKDATTDPVEEFREAALAYADIETDSGQPIATLNQILCITPRGRYDIKIYPNDFSLHGKKYNYKIAFKTIQHLFFLPHKNRQRFFVCSLASPIRQGQTRYHYLVFQFVSDEEIEIELGLTEDQLKQQYGNKLQRNLEGRLDEIVCKLFRILIGKKVTMPGNFVGRTGTPVIVCAHRQTSGFLYPLQKGFLYIHKPPMYICFNKISSVHFARLDISTRSFDFEVEMKSGTNLVFNSIEKGEYGRLYDYAQEKNLRIRNAKKLENTDLFADSDEEAEINVRSSREVVRTSAMEDELERIGPWPDIEDPEDEDYDLDKDLATRRKERELNSSEGSASEPTEEWDSSGSDVVKESDIDENEDGSQEKVKIPVRKRKKRSKDEAGEGRRKKRTKKKYHRTLEEKKKTEEAKEDRNQDRFSIRAYEDANDKDVASSSRTLDSRR